MTPKHLSRKNSDGAIYVLGYSAGGHDAIAFTHYLASINIAVRGMALFDPHSKFSLGRLNFDVPNNVGVTLNFFQTRPISIGQNTFQGSQVTGNNVFNVDVSYLPGMSHSSIFSDVMSQFGGQVDHVMGR